MTGLARKYYDQALSLQPDAIDALNIVGGFYAAHFQYQRAADLFERLSSLLPESAVVHYNLACLYALQNRPEKSVVALRTAIEKGYDDWTNIATDKDLENIHGTGYFETIMADRFLR